MLIAIIVSLDVKFATWVPDHKSMRMFLNEYAEHWPDALVRIDGTVKGTITDILSHDNAVTG